MLLNRRDLLAVLGIFATVREAWAVSLNLDSPADFPGPAQDYHGYARHDLAIGISAPVARFPREREADYAERVMAVAGQIGEMIGGRGE